MPLLRRWYQGKGFSQSFLIHLIPRLVFQPEFLIYLTSGSFCIWGSWNCTCVDHETGIPLSTLGITLYILHKETDQNKGAILEKNWNGDYKRWGSSIQSNSQMSLEKNRQSQITLMSQHFESGISVVLHHLFAPEDFSMAVRNYSSAPWMLLPVHLSPQSFTVDGLWN